MANQQIFKSLRGTITATAIAVSSMIAIASAATAVTLKVSVENLSPPNGNDLPRIWVAFHDGSFDYFNTGEPASPALKTLAETGYTGFTDNVGGLPINGDFFGVSEDATLASLFTKSSAAANGGIQTQLSTDYPGFLAGRPGSPGIFPPGYSSTKTITLNGDVANHRYFSFASNVVPTNDAFIGNDNPIEIFDANGNFIGADFVVAGNEVLDAGTEVNVETEASITLKSQSINENGIVQIHPGPKPLGTGGLLDLTFNGEKLRFRNANFKQPGYQVARIKITEVTKSVPEPSTTGAIAVAGFLILLPQVRRSMRRNPHLNLTHS
ncbi:MAG: spondin domain-containing protein [Nostoc sp. C3-bin3]|nr:spondin domain-containing protein [Nostoc sp. C3-bin3]